VETRTTASERVEVRAVAPSARELRRMPREQRQAILRQQAAEAATDYAADPELQPLSALDGEPFVDGPEAR